MKIYNAVGSAEIVAEYHKKTKKKLNILVAYPYLKGSAYKLTKEYRGMIESLYLDSGAYSVSKGKIKLSVSEYGRYIARYGRLFDEVFNLDDDFFDPMHNLTNQAYLERLLPTDAKKPIPVIHDAEDPFEEFKGYVNQGHTYIAVGSSKKIPSEVLKKISKKFPSVKIHMFGKLNRKMLAKHKPYSADASTWATAAGLGRFYYWDPEEKKEYLIVLNSKEKASGKNISYSEFPQKAGLDRFLKDTFEYDYSQLVADCQARMVVNLHFFKQLEEMLN
jgi:hypothetical protein